MLFLFEYRVVVFKTICIKYLFCLKTFKTIIYLNNNKQRLFIKTVFEDNRICL